MTERDVKTTAPHEAAQLRVLLFSVLREKVGRGTLDLALPAPATGAALLDQLARDYPALAPYRPIVRLAVNQEYTDESVRLEAGDEVALITPVSGG